MDHEKGVTRTQQRGRSEGSEERATNTRIEETKKSKQDTDTRLDRIRSRADLEEDDE